MTVRIRKGYQAEISIKGFGVTKIFAETLDQLDRAVEQHFAACTALKERNAKALMARLIGVERRNYKDARNETEG